MKTLYAVMHASVGCMVMHRNAQRPSEVPRQPPTDILLCSLHTGVEGQI